MCVLIAKLFRFIRHKMQMFVVEFNLRVKKLYLLTPENCFLKNEKL